MLSTDKIKHFAACLAISAFTAMILDAAGSTLLPCLIGSLLCGISAGAGKEYGDSKCSENFWDWWDILADVLGAVAGSFFSLLTLLS